MRVWNSPIVARAIVWCADSLCTPKKEEERRTTKSSFSLLIFSTVKRINGILGVYFTLEAAPLPAGLHFKSAPLLLKKYYLAFL